MPDKIERTPEDRSFLEVAGQVGKCILPPVLAAAILYAAIQVDACLHDRDYTPADAPNESDDSEK